MIFGLLILYFLALTGAPSLHAEGEFEEVFMQDDAGASDPSEFEGDSNNMPGERAPEYMPMEDAPVGAGLAIE